MVDRLQKVFYSAALGQRPVGPGLGIVRSGFGGGVGMLLVDVSGSIQVRTLDGFSDRVLFGMPVEQPLVFGRRAVDEAGVSMYDIGLILWNGGFAIERELTPNVAPAYDVLSRTLLPPGDTDACPAFFLLYESLQNYTGDRVIAVFDNGYLGCAYRVILLVEGMWRDNIRLITRCIGSQPAKTLGKITDEEPDKAPIDIVDELVTSVAKTAAALNGGVPRIQGG